MILLNRLLNRGIEFEYSIHVYEAAKSPGLSALSEFNKKVYTIKAWCEKNLKSNQYKVTIEYSQNTKYVAIKFYDEKDATAFKLATGL